MRFWAGFGAGFVAGFWGWLWLRAIQALRHEMAESRVDILSVERRQMMIREDISRS